MVAPNTCPLCTDTYEEETDLRIHLEVEHRKSELAVFAVRHGDSRSDPVVEDEPPTPSA